MNRRTFIKGVAATAVAPFFVDVDFVVPEPTNHVTRYIKSIETMHHMWFNGGNPVELDRVITKVTWYTYDELKELPPGWKLHTTIDSFQNRD